MSVVAIEDLIERGIYDVNLHPTVTLTQSQRNQVQLLAQGRADTGYNDPSDDYNTVFASAASKSISHEQHEKGLLGEAAVSIHHSPDRTLNYLDEDLTRCGDGGIDLEMDDWLVDVKTTEWGFEQGKTPLLKVKRDSHCEVMETVQHRDDATVAYYLVEKVSETELRLIGYITAEVFDERAERVREGETYRPEDEDYRFRSHADNLVVEPSDLWISYRDD